MCSSLLVHQVFSNEVLAQVWSGEITTWDHQSIADLNQGLALPAASIKLVYANDTNTELSEVLARALSNFSATFDSALEATGSLADVVPTGSIPGGNTASRLAIVQVRCSLSFRFASEVLRH